MNQDIINKRVVFLKFFFLAVTIFYVWYLGKIHFSNSLNLEKSVSLRYRPKKKILYPKRGNIYDRNGLLLVGSKRHYQLDFDLHNLRKIAKKRGISEKVLVKKIAKIISKDLGKKYSSALKKINKFKNRSSYYLGNKISETKCIQLENDLAEIHLKNYLIKKYTGFKRYYPRGPIAKRMIGDIVQDNNDKNYISINGETGIEKSFNFELSGKEGWREYYETASRKEIKYPLKKLAKKDAIDGLDLYLTIDYDFQRILDREIYDGVKRYKAQNGYGVFIDVNTGQILAMSSCSKQDLVLQDKIIRKYNDLNVVDSFEPGSTFKPFIALLALESGKLKSSDKIDCSEYHEKKRKIKDHHPFKKLTFKNIIAYSSNPGISRVSDLIGIDKFYQRLIDLGFKYKTNIRLPYESSGLMRNKNKWNLSSLHSISFGQEISVTSLQLVSGYAALANGGKVFQPEIWLKTTNKNGKLVNKNKPVIYKIISNKTSLDTLKTFLRAVVEYGTASKLEIKNLQICGKTGTAEKSIKGEVGYSKNDYYSVFAGFLPYDYPSIAGVIVYDTPAYEYHFGAAAAVPTFRNVIEKYLKLPGKKKIFGKEIKMKTIRVPNVKGLSFKEMKEKFEKSKIKFNVNQKSGKVISQIPQSGAKIPINERVYVCLENKENQKKEDSEKLKLTKFVMPNLIGLPIRNALKKASSARIRLIVLGSGIIYHQDIAPGTKVDLEDVCKVKAR